MGENMKSGKITMVVLVVLLLVGYFLLRGGGRSRTLGDDTVSLQATPEAVVTDVLGETTQATGDGSEVKTIKIEAGNFYFKPDVITIKKGEKVKLVLDNKGGFHDLLIDELGVNSGRIGEGKTIEVIFTPDKAGTFEFYCSVGNHRQMGMKGKITVE